MKRITAMVLTATLAASLVSCGGAKKERRTRETVRVRAVPAAKRLMPSPESFTGNVRSRQTIIISTKMMGRIQRVVVREGETVKKNQLLVEVDASEAKSAYEQSKAGLDAADVAVRNAKRDDMRFKTLYKEKAVTKHQLEQVEMGLAQAEAQKAQAEANLKMAATLLTYGKIRAPYKGIITKKWMDEGNLAYPGAPILTLENPGDLEISVDVPENTVRRLAVGQEATVNSDASTTALKVKIKAVVEASNPMSRTSIVKLALPDNAGLRPGQFARVHFDALAEKVLTVPTRALVHEGQMDGVFVIDGGKARLRWIQIGRKTPAYAQVTAGLKAGEVVAASVPPGLRDGDPVEVAR